MPLIMFQEHPVNNGKYFRADSNDSEKLHKQFCKSLKALNDGVLKWIEKHVAENPFIDLTPVFNDYCNHIKKLETKYKTESGDTNVKYFS